MNQMVAEDRGLVAETGRLMLRSAKSSAIAMLREVPTELHIPLVSECAEANRYLRPGVSEHFGRWKASSVPHLVEIMDRLHPDDPCTHVSVMKSVHSAVTVSVAENAMLLWIKHKIGSIAYFTSNQKIGKIRSSSAIDTMIDDSGIADLVKPMSRRVSQKRSDSATYKEFEGGIKLLIGSYKSIGDMKSNTFQLIIPDEWDEAPLEIADQGDTAGVLEGRTMSSRMYKILEISTPTRMETSRIYRSFLLGDQRRFFMPCPICGDPQELVLKKRDIDHGLTFSRMKDAKSGALILDPTSVRYICKHCKSELPESEKMGMLAAGWWQPTASPSNPLRHSYHNPGLISPFLSWQRICQRFIDTRFGEDIMMFKDFTINYLGNPWAKVEMSKTWEAIRDRADDYCMGEVPNGGLILYAGVDVQGDRLEAAVWAFGKGMEKWLVDYQVFFGDPANINDVCWGNLNQYVYGKKFTIKGVPVGIIRAAVDCGWDPKERRVKDWDSKAHTVFQFVGLRQDKFIAVRGAGAMTGTGGVVRPVRIQGDHLLKVRHDISTHVIKELLMHAIDLTKGPRAIHFPANQEIDGVRAPVSEDLFRGFLSERYQEIKPGVMGWKKTYQRNEPWDTTVYAIAASYLDSVSAWTDEIWDAYAARLAGAN